MYDCAWLCMASVQGDGLNGGRHGMLTALLTAWHGMSSHGKGCCAMVL